MTKNIRQAIVFLMAFATLFTYAQFNAQSPQSDIDSCEAVRYLMAQDATPYDLGVGGGVLTQGEPVIGQIEGAYYADFWSFEAVRAQDEFNNPLPFPVTFTFENVMGDLEFALYKGMIPFSDFAPLSTTQINIERDGLYTLVVRRASLTSTDPASYTLTAAHATEGILSAPASLPLANSDPINPAPPPAEIVGGTQQVNMPTANVITHAGGVRVVNTRNAVSTQVFFPNPAETSEALYTLHVGAWADELTFLTGDMSLRGEGRLYYLQNFGFETTIDGINAPQLDFLNIRYGDDTQIQLTWDTVTGIWVLEGCAGVKLTDGQQFVTPISPENRNVSFEGPLDQFEIAVDAPASPYTALIDWRNIPADGTVSYQDGIFDIPLLEGRSLVLQTNALTLFSQQPDEGLAQSEVTLTDREISLSLDWVNMAAFRVLDDSFEIDFLDEPRAALDFVRFVDGLALVEARNDVLRLIYDDGEQRTLLPASESYIEILTPATLPEFDGRALPDEAGYMPRALNNTGFECYRANTLLPEANCPPNGTVNPANGNLFYQITDLVAYGGGQLDLTLTRSYNSRRSHVDGPFGRGWATEYLLDYIVPFDETTLSRLITPDTPYQAGLDVTFAPRGLVTFTTPSGSRHQFVSQAESFDGGVLRALTMPGWTLRRDSVYAEIWTLEQVDGYVYTFDRAGRLKGWRTPDGAREIQIDYAGTQLAGLGAAESVMISDSDIRAIVLQFNTAGHITQATLVDQVAGCDAGCPTIRYDYTDGFLTGVVYPDGSTATYAYNDAGRLIEHDDSHAPFFPQMRYTYDQRGNVGSVAQTGGDAPYRQFTTIANAEQGQLTTTIIDDLNNRREYRYRYTVGTLRRIDNSFTLAQITSPLAGIEPFEDAPQVYLWEEGLLTRLDTRQLRPGEGRSATSIAYNQFGQVRCIACVSRSLPELSIEYDENPETGEPLPRPVLVRYSSGAEERYSYDAEGRVLTYTDTNDTLYTYTWDDTRLIEVLREADGARWTYTYNDVGLVASVSEQHGDGLTPHTLTYEYDVFGRLTTLTDSTLGTYTVAYESVEENGVQVPRVVTQDPVGTLTTAAFNARRQLVEYSTEANDELLTLTTYEYDARGRLLAESDWLIDGEVALPLTTEYTYERRTTISGLGARESGTVINGTEMTVTQPDGQTTRYAFDALGRIRRVEDPFQRRTNFDYFVSNMSGYQWGMRLEQRTLLSGDTDISQTTYLFDNKRQLRDVQQDTRRWIINIDGDSSRVASIIPQIAGSNVTLQGVFYGDYTGGKPNTVEARQSDLFLNSGFSVLNTHQPYRGFTYDFDGRVVAVTDAETNGGTTPIHYCPLDGGSVRVVYDADGCDAGTFALALTYDSAGRIIGADDAQGVRVFTYTPLPDEQVWRVDARFIGENGIPYTWLFTQDSSGRVLFWQDENGFERTYTYDSLGRLTYVNTADDPENTFSFRYDAGGRLLERTDGLGRGTLYNYNDQGQVTSQLDKFTADTTSYSYTPDGNLETVISPQGNTTTYLYDDPADTTRLTGIVEPTGSQHRFEWNDNGNILIYTDPLGAVIRYRYDGNGLLWRIDDAVQLPSLGTRMFELHYDDNGQMRAWVRDSRLGNVQSRYQMTPAEDGLFTITEEATGWTGTYRLGFDGRLMSLNGVNLTYDPLYRLAAIDTAEHSWTFSREPGVPQLRLEDSFGGDVQFRYDTMYRLLSETREDGSFTYAYTRGLDGVVIVDVAAPNGENLTYLLDPGDARTSTPRTITRVGAGYQTLYIYDSEGRLAEVQTQLCIDPDAPDPNTCAVRTTSQQFIYDTAGRPVRVVDADGNFEAFTYDEGGNLLTYQTKNGRRFNYTYDNAGRLQALTTPTGLRLIVQRNNFGDTTGICRVRIEDADDYRTCVDNGGEQIAYTVDALGRRTTMTLPLLDATTQVSYSYNSRGFIAGETRGEFVIGYDYDSLGQLVAVQSEGGQVSFTYDGQGRVAASGGVQYAYDNAGRLVAAGNTTYRYLPDAFEVLTDEQLALRYGLDSRGILTTLGDQITLTLPSSRRLTATRADGAVIQHVTTLNGFVESVNYDGGGDLTAIYQLDPVNTVRRQTILRPVDGVGYGVALGFDNDDRPLTLRVTDNTGLQVLYTQTFTYDKLGVLIREIRQFSDGSQLIIRNEYQNQLVRQLITVVRPGAQAALPLAGFLGLIFILMIAPFRSRRGMPLVAGVAVLALASFAPTLQTVGQTIAHDTLYSPEGNVESVIASVNDNTGTRVECARYDYDGLNRLTRVRYLDETGTEQQVSYAYDAFNRLVTTGDLTLTYNGETLFSISDDLTTHTVGATADMPAFYTEASDGAVTWLISDGRERTVQPVAADADPQPNLWLFDPLNRYLSLNPPPLEENPCWLSSTPTDLPAHLMVQQLTDGVIWDARTNLYIQDGRAYDPERGGYLQPSIRGGNVNVLGSLYSQSDATPPLVPTRPSYERGLIVLGAAEAQLRVNDALSADAVLASFVPSTSSDNLSMAHSLNALRAPYLDSMYRLENIPVWLRTAYNLEAPMVGASGAIIMPDGITPGSRSDAGFSALMPPQRPDWNLELRRGLPGIDALYAGQVVPTVPVSYLPAGGRATNSILESVFNRPQVTVYTPDRVLEWLPKPLESPAVAENALNVAAQLEAMPHTPIHEDVSRLIDETIPLRFTEPDGLGVMDGFFTGDLFGVEGTYAQPSFPVMPDIQLPGMSLPD